jgi:2-phosphosulfolactate phosphatase
MINFEWGKHGIRKYSASSDITVIVDILSFSSCVDIAISNGALLYPYRYKDDSAVEYAESLNAELASFKRSAEIFSLSPVSLKNIPSGTKIVLPSPNGSELSLLSESRITICACLRNFNAVGEYINTIGGNVTVIAAGEKWQH